MAYGLGDDTMALLEQDWNRRRAVSQPAQPTQATQKRGNFLTSLIPTGTGIAGTLGGAAAGAAVGSVVPVVGTAVGGLIGAILGGAGGSAAGKVGQNAIEGNELGEGVLGEAALGGLTALPIGAGARLAQAGVKATTGIGKKAASDLVQEAGVKTLGKGTINRLTAAGTLDQGASDALGRITAKQAGKKGANKLQQTGARMLASQGQITGAQARQMGINSVETFGNVNRRTGLTNLDDMAEVGRSLTGRGDDSLLDVLTREAVSGTSGVDLSNLRTAADKLIQSKGGMLTNAQRNSIMEKAQGAGVALRGGANGSIGALADPNAALDAANSFRSSASMVRRTPMASPEQRQMAEVFNGLADEIETAIYRSPGVTESIPQLGRYGANSLREMAGEAAAAGNKAQQQAYLKLADEVAGIKSVKDLRTLKKDFVQLGKIDDATAQVQGARTVTGADLGSKAGQIVRNPMNLLAMPLDAATPRIAGALTGAGNRLAGGAGVAAGQSVAGTAVRQGGARLLTADAPQQELDPLGQQQELSALNGAQASPDALYGQEAQQSASPMGYSSQQLGQALMAALSAGDTKAAAQLQSMYELAAEMEASQNPQADLDSTTRRSLAQSANGEATLDQLEQLLGQAGGGQGLAGNLTNFAGSLGLNAEARTFNDLADGSVAQIAKALGETGALSNSDIAAYRSMLPRITDSQQVAQAKIAALRQRLQSAQQNSLLYGAGGADTTANTLQAY